MEHKNKGVRSEPDLLVEIADRLAGWAVLVGLVGEGQEIHSGEEGGLTQWHTAIESSPASGDWSVSCPPHLGWIFDGLEVDNDDRLNLKIPVRSRRAEQLADWVGLLLDGKLHAAAPIAREMADAYFPIYVTRSLLAAKRYAEERYADAADARYGILVSSHAKGLLPHGIDNSYMATNRVFNVARWFNADKTDSASCCAFERVATEFACQGLELDLPIVVWGNDMQWTDNAWRLNPIRRRYQQNDPASLLKNTYRVLLTRGRDGVLIFVPPSEDFTPTALALIDAGAQALTAKPAIS
jgi:hypothetical protein